MLLLIIFLTSLFEDEKFHQHSNLENSNPKLSNIDRSKFFHRVLKLVFLNIFQEILKQTLIEYKCNY